MLYAPHFLTAFMRLANGISYLDYQPNASPANLAAPMLNSTVRPPQLVRVTQRLLNPLSPASSLEAVPPWVPRVPQALYLPICLPQTWEGWATPGRAGIPPCRARARGSPSHSMLRTSMVPLALHLEHMHLAWVAPARTHKLMLPWQRHCIPRPTRRVRRTRISKASGPVEAARMDMQAGCTAVVGQRVGRKEVPMSVDGHPLRGRGMEAVRDTEMVIILLHLHTLLRRRSDTTLEDRLRLVDWRLSFALAHQLCQSFSYVFPSACPTFSLHAACSGIYSRPSSNLIWSPRRRRRFTLCLSTDNNMPANDLR